MVAPITPQQVAQTRGVPAGLLLRGMFDIRSYPHQHITVFYPGQEWESMPQLLAAADHLAQFGWELVNITELGVNRPGPVFHAIFRRR